MKSLNEVLKYSKEYLSYLVENDNDRGVLFKKVERLIKSNITSYGLPSYGKLQDTISTILDNHKKRFEVHFENDAVLDIIVENNHFSKEENNILSEDKIEDKGEKLRELIKSNFKGDFSSFCNMFCNEKAFIDEMTYSNIDLEEILINLHLKGGLSDKLSILFKQLNFKENTLRSDILCDYALYLNKTNKESPFNYIDKHNKIFLRKQIIRLHKENPFGLGSRLKQYGFGCLIKKEGGILKLVKKVAPTIVLDLSHVKLWKNKNKSKKIALSQIERALYKLPGYKEAEQGNKRSEQVIIINELLSKENLSKFMLKEGLRPLMSSFIDTKGINGIKKGKSPKALLEFYSKNKCLDWFNRSRKSYVSLWKMSEKNKWNDKEKSVKLAIEVIEDILYEIPGYKNAEDTGNSKEVVRLINKFIIDNRNLKRYLSSKGMNGLIGNFLDPTGKYGIKVKGSPKAIFKFYSEQKGFNWFSTKTDTYIDFWRFGQKEFKKDKHKYAKHIIKTLEGIFYKIPNYREAENSNNTLEQLYLINQFVVGAGKWYFKDEGFFGIMINFIDPKGEYGFTHKRSSRAVLKFYSKKKKLNWFDKNKPVHFDTNKQKRVILVEVKSIP